jgi:hypothetical protein
VFGFLLDDGLRAELNGRDQNYWDAYLQDINDHLGLRGSALTLADLEQPACLERLRSVVVGRQSGSHLSDAARGHLRAWVERGGTLIGFGIQGLDDVFGVHTRSVLAQQPDDYTIAGCLALQAHPLTEQVHSRLAPEQPLLIISDIQSIDLQGADQVARRLDATGNDTAQPGITWHHYGRGTAGYFAFDVAKTIWLLHQGRPVLELAPGNRYLRANQLHLVGQHSYQVGYADELLLLIQNMLAPTHQPFVYQMPPDGGRVPDALFYWGGDCWYGNSEMVEASDWFRSKSLPYHINVSVRLTSADWMNRLLHVRDENGHEVSLYWEMDGDLGLTETSVQAQSDYAYEHFGFRPGSTVTGPCTWAGWAEPARWLAKAGAAADNSFVGQKYPYSHPLMNDSFFGSGHGTYFPFFFRDDFTHGNQRIDLVEQPIVCYEVGHHGSTWLLPDLERQQLDEVHAAVDLALQYRAVMNIFYHPGYVARFPRCREAIDEMLRYIAAQGAHILHMANDQVAAWWRARSRTRLDIHHADDDHVAFSTACPYAAGMIARLWLGQRLVETVECDGQSVPYHFRREFGGLWLYVVLPGGVHRTDIAFTPMAQFKGVKAPGTSTDTRTAHQGSRLSAQQGVR